MTSLQEFPLNLDDVRAAEPVVPYELLIKAKARANIRARDYPSLGTEINRDEQLPVDPARLVRPPKICSSALDLVGKTPMIRLDRLARFHQLSCELGTLC